MIHIGHLDYTKLKNKLKEAGYTTYSVRKDGILGNGTLQAIREGRAINTAIIVRLCELLHCQPGDLMTYVSDAEEAAQEGEKGEIR